MDELERAPNVPPVDPDRGVETKALIGPESLFRIAVRRGGTDPGYRALYALDRDDILVLRIARRDAATYVGLRRALHLVRSRRNAEPGHAATQSEV
jgi:hypothetical protein